MNDNVVDFASARTRKTVSDIRAQALRDGVALSERMKAMGTPMEWQQSAVAYLRELVEGRTGHLVPCSVAAIHIVLACADTLEQVGALPPAGGAA